MSLRLGPFQPQPLLSNEKEICVSLCPPYFQQGGFFKLRVLFGVLLCFAGVTIVLFALGKASAQPRTPAVQTNTPWDGFAAANKIAPWVMEHTANGQQAEFFVVLADQADLSAAASLPTKAEKGRFVYQTLLEQGSNHARPDPAMAARTRHRASLLLHR